jgi:regulator of RNase E activity RraA
MSNKLRNVGWFALAGVVGLLLALHSLTGNPGVNSDDALIAGFKTVDVATVSDAVDAVVGKPGFMFHDMRPISTGRFVGPAVTALVKPAPREKATATLAVKDSVEMIDNAKPGDVGVIVIENGLDTAAMGDLMGTDAKARGLAGMVLDGGVRDVPDLRKMGLLVFARSITPATAVGRFASVGRNIPVRCAGVMVNPGDIIVAGEDGVVVVPRAKAADVLKESRRIDAQEDKMVPLIKQYKSLQKVVEMFKRI